MKRYAFVFVVVLAVCGAAFGEPVYVDSANTGGPWNGFSWETAFQTIQEGIDDAGGGDEVWVAAGTYEESITLVSGIPVYGGFDGTEENLSERDMEANVTMIDASSAAVAPGSLTTLFASDTIGASGNMFDVEVTGPLTITGFGVNLDNAGSTNTIEVYYRLGTSVGAETSSDGWILLGTDSSVVSNGTDTPTPVDIGGLTLEPGQVYGFYVDLVASSPAVLRYTDGGPTDYSNADMTITTNCANHHPPFSTIAYPREWNGIIHYSTPTAADHAVVMDNITDARIDGFIITGGYADGLSWPHYLGGGILCNAADDTNRIANCTVTGNSATFGGGLTCVYSDVEITKCTISGNSASSGGGGVVLAESVSQITNCVIAGNSASTGGGVLCETAAPSIANCTISANEASAGGGVYCRADSSPPIVNTILVDNTNHAIYELDAGSDPTVTNCLFYNNPDGDYYDNDTAATYTGPSIINSTIPEASDNAGGDPYFVMIGGGTLATAGTWTDVTPGSGITTLTDNTASFTADALVGKLINPDHSQRGQLLIVANTETTIDVMGDVTGYVAATDMYRVSDYHLRYFSGAIDTGTASGAPYDDFDGEPRPFDLPGTGADDTGEEYDIGADECVDTDDDHLPDYAETRLGTNPDDPDSDDDGLTDYFEVILLYTDPLDSDTDDDGLSDYEEYWAYWTDPLDDDSDDDGLDDGEEVLTYATIPWDPDSDADGVSDGDEVNTYGSDPGNADSDDDGYTDGTEVTAGSELTDPDSYPLWYVDQDATGAADGTSWADAFTTIQDGIGAAAALGGEVWVADGTYPESVTLTSGVAIMGGFDGTEELLAEQDIASNMTIIDATYPGEQTIIGAGTSTYWYLLDTWHEDGRWQTIYLASEIGGPGPLTSLAIDVHQLPGPTNNWTIRMKHTSLTEYATASWEDSGWTTVYQNNETVSSAGWMTFSLSTPFHYNGTDNLMIDFSFDNDSVSDAFGTVRYTDTGSDRMIYYTTNSAYGNPLTWSGTSDPTPRVTTELPNIRLGVPADHAVLMDSTTNARIDGFTITGGYADGAYPHNRGGGVYCNSADATNTIANCTITANQAAVRGGGVYCYNSSPSISGCIISGNNGGWYSGGMVCHSGSSPSIVNCTISGNYASDVGGGVECYESSPTITNCTISANEASVGGGMSCTAGSSPWITNTIFEDNTNHAVYEWTASDDPTVTNCLFYNNPDGDYFDEGITSYTGAEDINANVSEASGNVDGDPLFVMNGPAGITGTWTAVTPDSGVTILTDGSASFTPGALVGMLINANTSQRGQVLIVANTATTVEVLEDVTGYVAVDNAYAVVDYHLRLGSPGIDTGAGAVLAELVADVEPNDTIETAQNIDGEMWNLNFSPDIGDATTNTSTSIPHVTINGTGNGTYDVYSFTVANAGDRGIFDIDYGTQGAYMDSYLRLYDSVPTAIVLTDNSLITNGQGGSVHIYDSYWEYTFPAPGTYYIRVAEYEELHEIPIGDGHTYQLQVSIENHPWRTTPPLTDFDGEPRPINVAGLGADGTGEEFDIGADEYLDSDGDGLSDQEEEVLGTDPDDSDTDNDGLTDGDEVNTHDTDPNDPDSDDDGLPDGWEVDNGFNPLDDTGDNGGDGDPDEDGLTNEEELANDTDPTDPDSDDDGLPDGDEVVTYETDPTDADSDDDGLSDGDEVTTHETNPNDSDSDDDTLPDGWEVDNDLDPTDDTGDDGDDGDPDGDDLTNAGEYGNDTDPNDADSDDDGLPDGWEVANNLDPNDATGDNGADGDPDGDGHTNLEEYEEGYNPQLSAPVAAFSASATSGLRPLAVDFTDETAGSVTASSWNFGDGYDSTDQNPSHTYYFTGDFTATLTVSGPGGVDSESAVIHVDQALPAPGGNYKTVVRDIKVKYNKPTCFATYNHLQDTLLIAVWGEDVGTLNVTCGKNAYIYWGSPCDIVIDAPDATIKKINLKGRPETQLYVCGQVGYVENFALKYGSVGDTLYYGPDIGLGSAALNPPKKITIKSGFTTAALLGVSYPGFRFDPAHAEDTLAIPMMELKSKPFEVFLDEEGVQYDELDDETGEEDDEFLDDEDIDSDNDPDDDAPDAALAGALAVGMKAGYKFEWDDIKVSYSKPGCLAYYNSSDGTLTIEIWESDGNLKVTCGKEAYLYWGDYCDIYIDASDASIKTINLKGRPETQLHVCGEVGYVKNFVMKYGCVGDTDYYGPEFGLGNTSLEVPNKINIKYGWTTAPLLGVSY